MNEVTQPASAIEFIEQIAPPDADAAWKAQAIFWADIWACSLKKFAVKNMASQGGNSV